MRTKAPKIPKPKPLFARNEVVGLAKRYLKPGQYNPVLDTMVMYQLVKQFPSKAFWLNYFLDFQLNSLFWFKGEDGQKALKTRWELFNFHPEQPEEVKLEAEKVGEDIVVEKKKVTVADLLR